MLRKDDVIIDFVITWVDGSDEKWIQERKKYETTESKGDERDLRYRDWGLLKYLLRSIEKFAPWVNKVYLVTCGHYPSWLNIKCDKLELISHDDYIPEEYLPTFSNRPIELNLHRIPGLSERFVYFNDDMLLLNKVEKTDFFRNGLPCDSAIMGIFSLGREDREIGEKIPIDAIRLTPLFDMLPINRNFDKRKAILSNLPKWFNYRYGRANIRNLMLAQWPAFTAMVNYHLPYSYLKSSFEEVWNAESELLDYVCKHKFRQSNDINQWVMGYWQIAKGEFAPRNPGIGRYFSLSSDSVKNSEAYKTITNQEVKMICLNDNVMGNEIDFNEIRNELQCNLDKILSDKSIFEL